MKQRLAITLLLILMTTGQSVLARSLEVEVHGMTCAFCVDSLERKLSAMPSVVNVQVSLKDKRVRLTTEGDTPDVEAIKQAILETGFTPIKITVLNGEKHQQ